MDETRDSNLKIETKRNETKARASERNLCRAIKRVASLVSETRVEGHVVPGDNFKGRRGTCCTYATFSRITFRITFQPSWKARRNILFRSPSHCGWSKCGSVLTQILFEILPDSERLINFFRVVILDRFYYVSQVEIVSDTVCFPILLASRLDFRRTFSMHSNDRRLPN